MPIGNEQQQRVRNHLQGRNNRCPVCDANNWTVFEDLLSPFCIDVEYRRPIEVKFLPIVALICNDCGYVRQIAARKVGLIS
jgi:C4-type Zn-finger protein